METILSITPRALRNLAPNTSLGDIARGVGVTTSYMSHIFNGRRTPSLNVAVRMAVWLNVSLDEVYAAISEASATIPLKRAA